MADRQRPIYQEIARRDADLYARLAKAGFLLDFGVDGSGLMMKALRTGSGYYIDVGGSELIARGAIKLKAGVEIKEVRPHSVAFRDGSELPADLIVYATGYQSMNRWLAQIISEEAADAVGPCWGRVRHARRPRPLAGRTPQHVETDSAPRPLVPWRQSRPLAALLALSRASAQGALRGDADAGLPVSMLAKGLPLLSRFHRRAELDQDLGEAVGRGARTGGGDERDFRVGDRREAVGRTEHAMIGENGDIRQDADAEAG